MDDQDKSGLRHRGVTQPPKIDNNVTTLDDEQEPILPAAPPNSPVDAQPPSREYNRFIDPKTGREVLIWHSPRVPYMDGVELVEQKAAEPVTLATVLSGVLKPLGVINNMTYLGLLFATAGSVPSQMFAVGQLNENMGTILEGVWGTILGLARDRTPRPNFRMVGNHVPSVDVFVVCCGEPNDVILDTVKAACKIDWPAPRLRVIVADDGKSASLQQQVGELQGTHQFLHYYSRDKLAGVHHGYKAGNLNRTLMDYVEKLPPGYSEYFAVFDADMMPEADVIRALVPYALEDDRVGMVTCAQFHYNVPNDDPLNQGNTTGTGAEDGARDRVNAGWCPGSGFLMRTEAWNNINGFPDFSITEDLITSWYLHGRAWKIVLVPGTMQWGLQPDCLLTHLKQRRRWWTGHMPDALRFNLTLWSDDLSDASFMQRYAMLQHTFRPYTMTTTHAISTLLVLMCLCIGSPVIGTSSIQGLKQVVICLTITRLFTLIEDIKSILGGYYLKLRCIIATGVWMGHHFSRDTIQNLLPTRFGGERLGFKVSGVEDKPQIAVKERDLANRPPLATRLWTIHQREGILWHLALFLVTVAIVIYRVCAEVKASTIDGKFIAGDIFWLSIIKSVGFPGLALIDNVPYYLTPVIYVIFPPTMPERRELMVQDEGGLWKPKEEYKEVKYGMAS